MDFCAGTVDRGRRAPDDLPVYRSGEGVGLSAVEQRLLPLLATPLSLTEIAVLVELPREEIEQHAVSIFEKLGLRVREDPA
jgi:ATP/maltotriose-dependent transcriptional regulator MalT